MPYYRPRNPQTPQQTPAQQTGPGVGNAWETVKAPFQGFWQGFSGKNKSYEQFQRDKKRKRRGLPTSNPNWLQRVMNFK